MRRTLMLVAVAVACSACGDEGSDDASQAQRHLWRDADGCFKLDVPVAQLCELPAVYVAEGRGCYADFATPQSRPLGPVYDRSMKAVSMYSPTAILRLSLDRKADGTMLVFGECSEADATGALQPAWEVNGFNYATEDSALCRPCGDL